MGTNCTNRFDSFCERYFQRLGIDSNTLPSSLHSYDLLSQLTEAHLAKIPFENLAQHGGAGGKARLDMEAIGEKILDRNRGGFCLELNILFGELLERLGFEVITVPAVVYKVEKGGFDHPPTHVMLVVSVPTNDRTTRTNIGKSQTFLVDVGFGEPPIHPLRYSFDEAQATAEGMRSRIVQSDGDGVVLEWFLDAKWTPRLQWNAKDCMVPKNPPIQNFQPILDLVHESQSSFSRKLIVCKITREKKETMSGHKFKETGPPRFGDNKPVTVKDIGSLEDARQLLVERFGISKEETSGLADWQHVTSQEPSLFAHLL